MQKITIAFPYFRNGVSTMTVRELFNFITDLSITTENLDEYLERAMQISSQRSHTEVSEKEKIDEEVSVWYLPPSINCKPTATVYIRSY